MIDDPVLECQDCGRILLRLSLAQAQQVADNPYNFIAHCGPCQTDQRPLVGGYRYEEARIKHPEWFDDYEPRLL